MASAAERAEPQTELGADRDFTVLMSKDGLTFREITIHNPMPLGRDLLARGGFDQGVGTALFAILPSGDFEDVRLEEPFDLRGRGAERFVAFETDRTFRLTLAGRQIEWGKPALSGAVLASLVELEPNQTIFVHVTDGEDRAVDPTELFDLTRPGVERFYVGVRATETEIVVNGRGRTVPGDQVSFEQIVQIAFPADATPGVVFSMTYRHAASQPHAGDLAAGGHVLVKKGTVFNVTRTVQS